MDSIWERILKLAYPQPPAMPTPVQVDPDMARVNAIRAKMNTGQSPTQDEIDLVAAFKARNAAESWPVPEPAPSPEAYAEFNRSTKGAAKGSTFNNPFAIKK